MGSPSTDRELVRRHGFYKYCQLAWEHIPLEKECVWEPHMRVICDHYQAMVRGEMPDLINPELPENELVVNVPPGMSKTIITSILLCTWDWGPNERPDKRYIYASYSDELVTRDGWRARQLMLSDWWQDRWGERAGGATIVDGEKAAKTLFYTTKGGMRLATTMNGQVTGFHAHILVVDDPLKPKDIQAGGDAAREKLEKCNETWDQTFSSRTGDAANFKRIVIMQRLHYNDLAGLLIKRGARALVLPMEFEPSRAYVSEWGSDWRTKPGELLAPRRFPDHVIVTKKSENSLRDWATQYQQRPSPEDGSLFLRDFFSRRWDILPPMSKWIISVDATFKETKKSDYCVVQCQGMRTATEFYLIDQFRRRAGFYDAINMVKTMKAKWPNISTILVEDKANGSAIVEALRRTYTGVTAVTPEGGKEARANRCEPLYRENCVFPSDRIAPWMEEYIEEHIAFPAGENDDQVDCSTQGFNWLSTKTASAIRKRAMANVRGGRFR